jgi:molybdopterin-binding protein
MWRRNALDTKIKEINEVVEMFDRHEKGIINAIITGANNARADLDMVPHKRK